MIDNLKNDGINGDKEENLHSNRGEQSNGDRNSYFFVNPFIWEVEQKNSSMEALEAAIKAYFTTYWRSSYFEIQSRIDESAFANDTVCAVYVAGNGNKRPNQEQYASLLNSGGIKMLVSIPIKIKDHESRMIWVGTASPSRIDVAFDSSLDLLRRQLTIAFIAQNREDKVKRQDLELNHLKSLLKAQGVHIQGEKIKQEVFPDIIGQSSEMKEVFSLINRVSPSETTVLILGETGTGKELIAKAIHNGSSRRGKIMVKVNCAAIPASLIESELFGHEKGSFTGATDRRIGKFELAHNGTIFLDEIGELPLELQVKLLRVIQEKEIERIGGKKTITTDVRIISATNRNLWQEVENGQFRRDLFYRLNVFPIALPSLRSRSVDIPILANYFLERFVAKFGRKKMSFSKKALSTMLAYHWPGNVRELEHFVERHVLMTREAVISDLEIAGVSPKKNNLANGGGVKTIAENEREHIFKVLELCNGRISGPGGAAKLLGVPATTLNSKIKKLGLKKIHR